MIVTMSSIKDESAVRFLSKICWTKPNSARSITKSSQPFTCVDTVVSAIIDSSNEGESNEVVSLDSRKPTAGISHRYWELAYMASQNSRYAFTITEKLAAGKHQLE